MKAIFFVPVLWALQTRNRPVPAEQCTCCGAGSSEVFAVPEKSCSKIWMWFENCFVWRQMLFKALFYWDPLSSEVWMGLFLKKELLCSCNRNIFLLGETSFPSKCGHSLIFKCSSFAFSVGHCFLPCFVEALSLLQEAGCPCHDCFVPVLAAAVVSGASARFCCTLLLLSVFKMHPCAPADVWGWDTVGTPSAQQLQPSRHILGNKSIP